MSEPVREPHRAHQKQHAFSEAFDFYLKKASELKVSDIHFAPRECGGEVRFRVSGLLQTYRKINASLDWDDLIKEVKRRATLAFQKGFAQDSRFSEVATNSDYRVSLVPVQLGAREAEQIVVRILPRDSLFSLDKLGLPADAFESLTKALNGNQGLIVVTGPTGSGKTVTLMSALMAIDRLKYSVLTLEDPVEYALAGITQVQVSEKLTFANGLRAFLRQDPDYILVGETRDSETASALIQAANTGHVVLTTLHTNSALDVFSRLGALGVDENLVRANATFICAQRLVPRLCRHCKSPDLEGAEILQKLFPTDFSANEKNKMTEKNENFHIPMNSLGCERCAQTGVEGRELLFEFISPQRTATGTKELVCSSSLLSAAIALVKKGLINVQELASLA